MISDFIFDGKALSDFGYMLSYENSEDVLDVSKMQYNTVKGALSDVSYRVSYSYEQNYTSTFTIVKSYCDFEPDELFMTNDDISEMTRWLARKQYKWFRFIDDNDDDEIWYKVQFQIAKEYVGDNVIGLQLTVTADSPYGFTREIKREVTDTEVVNISSDEEGYIYPTCRIECASGTVNITVVSNGNTYTTIIKNCTAGEIITIDGETLQISSSVDHDFTKDFNYVFPRLCNTYGNGRNEITVSSGTTLTLKYRGIRKVGLE